MMARAGITADRLVEAAADLADEVGFESVTLSALARRFGVKDASLYSHVRSLHDLRTRVAILAGGEMIDRISTAVAGRAARTPWPPSPTPTVRTRWSGRAGTRPPRSGSTSPSSPPPPPSPGPPRSRTGCSARTASTNPISPTPSAC